MGKPNPKLRNVPLYNGEGPPHRLRDIKCGQNTGRRPENDVRFLPFMAKCGESEPKIELDFNFTVKNKWQTSGKISGRFAQ